MRAFVLSLLVITTATAATVLYSTDSSHRPVVNPVAVLDFGYRFYDHFCRAQYNNSTDRNACMTQATGMPLHASNGESDDR